MSAPIHPELARLHERYSQLVEGVRSGAVDAGEAYRLLEQITSFDASGALWGVDQDGSFTRRVTPDAAPQVTPPGLYAAPAAPGQVASPFAPGIAHPVEQPVPAAVRIPPQRSLPSAETQLPSDESLARPGRRTAPGKLRRPALPGGLTGGGNDGFLARFVATNRTTLVVAAAVTCVVLIAGVTRPEPGPAVPATSSSSVAASSIPVEVLPTTDDLARVVKTLLGGGATAASVVREPGDTSAAAAEAGRWLAYGNAKLRVSAGPAVASGDGAVQPWTVIDAAGGAVQQLEVSWVRTASGWQLASWPRLK